MVWGGLRMTPPRSSGCGACIPELTTARRHRGQLLCLLGSRAKASTLQGEHRRFMDDSALHTSFRGAPLLVGDTAAEVISSSATSQQVVQSLIPHNYIQKSIYAGVPSTL